MYAIMNIQDNDLLWSNESGWTDSGFDLFTAEEKKNLNLPMGGMWRLMGFEND